MGIGIYVLHDVGQCVFVVNVGCILNEKIELYRQSALRGLYLFHHQRLPFVYLGALGKVLFDEQTEERDVYVLALHLLFGEQLV